MSNTQLEEMLAGQPPDVQDEIIRHQHRGAADRPPGRAPGPAARRRSLGLLNSFRMLRVPEPKPSAAAEGMALG